MSIDDVSKICGEEDCYEAEYLVPCRLVVYRGDVPWLYVLRFHGIKAFWEYLRRGYYEEYSYYCASHCQKNGFCYGCGEFWAGSESFDFSPTGLCSNCKDDPDLVGYEDDEDYYETPEDYYEQREYEAEPDYEGE